MIHAFLHRLAHLLAVNHGMTLLFRGKSGCYYLTFLCVGCGRPQGLRRLTPEQAVVLLQEHDGVRWELGAER